MEIELIIFYVYIAIVCIIFCLIIITFLTLGNGNNDLMKRDLCKQERQDEVLFFYIVILIKKL